MMMYRSGKIHLLELWSDRGFALGLTGREAAGVFPFDAAAWSRERTLPYSPVLQDVLMDSRQSAGMGCPGGVKTADALPGIGMSLSGGRAQPHGGIGLVLGNATSFSAQDPERYRESACPRDAAIRNHLAASAGLRLAPSPSSCKKLISLLPGFQAVRVGAGHDG